MRVSFDLDEVLFVDPNTFETEDPPRFPFNRIYRERLRKGTIRLIHTLQEEDFEVWVYTSSFRSQGYIKSLFRQYGIRFDEIVNMPRHLKEVQKNHPHPLPQKMPGYYRIGLHVDDEDVIHQNGRRYGFRTCKVCDPDPDWVEKVLKEARRVRDINQRNHKHKASDNMLSGGKQDGLRNTAGADDPGGSEKDGGTQGSGEGGISGENGPEEGKADGASCQSG